MRKNYDGCAFHASIGEYRGAYGIKPALQRLLCPCHSGPSAPEECFLAPRTCLRSLSFGKAGAAPLGGRVVKLVLRPREARTGGPSHNKQFSPRLGRGNCFTLCVKPGGA